MAQPAAGGQPSEHGLQLGVVQHSGAWAMSSGHWFSENFKLVGKDKIPRFIRNTLHTPPASSSLGTSDKSLLEIFRDCKTFVQRSSKSSSFSSVKMFVSLLL